MSPSLAQMQAAEPKCPRMVTGGHFPTTWEHPCAAPLTYDSNQNVWRCPEHGVVLTGWQLAARMAAA